MTLEQLGFRGTDLPHSKESAYNYIVRGYLELLRRRFWLPYRDFNVILYSVHINIYTQSHDCRSPVFIFINNDPGLWRYKRLNKYRETESLSSMSKTYLSFFIFSLFFFFFLICLFFNEWILEEKGKALKKTCVLQSQKQKQTKYPRMDEWIK